MANRKPGSLFITKDETAGNFKEMYSHLLFKSLKTVM